MQKNEDELPEPEIIEKTVTKYVDKEIEKIIDNDLFAQTLKDRVEIIYNGDLALTASVKPDSLTMVLPVAQHTPSTITGDNNRWKDSHGMGFTGSVNQTQLEGLNLVAYLKPASPFSDTLRIHRYVTMLDGEFLLEGYATDEKTGKSSTFSIPVPTGRYFMCDDSVEVQKITETEYQIVYRDTTEYIHIDRDLIIVNGIGYGTINFIYGEKSFEFRMDLDSLSILRKEAEWGVATKVFEDRNGFNLSDKQHGKYTVKENGVSMKNVSLNSETIPFVKLNDTFKYGTNAVNVRISYTDKTGEEQVRTFQVSGYYFHEKAVEKTPDVVTPVVTGYTYTVDKSTKIVDHTADGSTYGEKMTVKVTRDQDGKIWKYQFMMWETGCLLPTVTGTQVADTVILRRDYRPEDYSKDGWAGTFNEREGFTRVATAKAYLYDTYFKAVEGFSKKEHAAHSQIVFGTSTVTFTDAETGYTETIYTAGTTDIKVVEDEVIYDNAAETRVNSRGLEYHYIGSHKLSVEQFVNGEKVYSQTRNEDLLAPNN
jgi:hypothetical protein